MGERFSEDFVDDRIVFDLNKFMVVVSFFSHGLTLRLQA
jgi:hypothetical protein